MAGLVAAWWLSRRVLRPLERLSEGTRRIASGDLAARVSVPSDSELAAVATAFNQMAATLERVEELQVSSAGARLARYVMKLPAKGASDPLEVELPLAKKDLAAHLAITPETLSRLLRRWQDQGIVETRGKRILLLDSRVLTAIADEA